MTEWKLSRYSLGEQPDGMQLGKVHLLDARLRLPRLDAANVLTTPLRISPLGKPAIDITPMSNILDNDVRRLCIHLIHDAVIPDSQAVQTLSTLQFS
jgi:hypothetical protein